MILQLETKIADKIYRGFIGIITMDNSITTRTLELYFTTAIISCTEACCYR